MSLLNISAYYGGNIRGAWVVYIKVVRGYFSTVKLLARKMAPTIAFLDMRGAEMNESKPSRRQGTNPG